MDFITEPFDFAFMQRAFIAAGFAAIACAVVGTYVVLKGLAFMGDAIAHSSLTGMAAAFVLGGSAFLGALAWVVPASLAITYISRRGRLMMDTSIGIIYAGGLALGIIIISRVSNYTADLFSFLFGNVLAVSWGEIIGIGVVAAVVIATVFIFYKELLFTAYDETMAAASGVPVRLVQYMLPLLLGVTTVAAVKTVGIVLVLALLVIPAATAILLVRRFLAIMGVSVATAIVTTVVGLYLSFHLDLPSGPAIVLVAVGLFAVAMTVSPSSGILRRGLASDARQRPFEVS